MELDSNDSSCSSSSSSSVIESADAQGTFQINKAILANQMRRTMLCHTYRLLQLMRTSKFFKDIIARARRASSNCSR